MERDCRFSSRLAAVVPVDLKSVTDCSFFVSPNRQCSKGDSVSLDGRMATLACTHICSYPDNKLIIKCKGPDIHLVVYSIIQ